MSGWISVKDGLPPEDAPVLGWVEGEAGFRCVVCRRFRLRDDSDEYGWAYDVEHFWEYLDKDPTHWMPLPKNPNGE